MNRSAPRVIIHPFLFAVYPVLYLYSYNADEVFLKEIFMPAFVSLGISSVLWIILNFILKDKIKSAFFTTLFLFFFFSYGHVFEYLEQMDVFVPAYRHKQLIPLILLVWGYTIYFARKAMNFRVTTKILNLIAFFLVLINVLDIVVYEIKMPRTKVYETGINQTQEDKRIETSDIEKLKSFPDIYYIVLDEYASLDTIKNIYNYEDPSFENFLIEKGFFIANKSMVRYNTTNQSLHSSLNMKYVNEDIPPKDLYIRILDNKVARYLKSIGYKYIYISGLRLYEGTHSNPYADLDLEKLKSGKRSALDIISPFNLMVIKTTMIRGLYYKVLSKGLRHRDYELLKLSLLKKIVSMDGPKFVYSHHLLSHTPFVFDSNGGMIDLKNHYNWRDKEIYLGAYIFATKEIMKLISTILENSKNPPIIIIQSDHGPRGGQGTKMNSKKLNLGEEWQKIFNAYYLPNGGNEKLYDSISHVNTFRLIFNQYFDENYELLED